LNFWPDYGDNIDVLNIDLSKAFDTDVHAKLLLKLSWYGIFGKILYFIKSYLTNRSQCTLIEGVRFD